MKGTQVDARVAAAAVALGSLGGCFCGYVLARSRARREYATRLDEAVAEVKAHYQRPIFQKPESPDTNKGILLVPNRTKWSDVVRGTLEVKSVHDPLEGLGDGSLDLEPADEDHGSGAGGTGLEGEGVLSVSGAGPESVTGAEPDGPFQITEAAFGELADEGFQTISVTFYAGDKVLAEQNGREEPIRDVIGTIGTANPLGYAVLADGDDPQIRYVRNRRLEVDFEILLDARSYTEAVLGYGQPNKRREASPAATE